MKHHCEAKRMVKLSLLYIIEPLSANFLNFQMCFLKLTMKMQMLKPMVESFDMI